MDYTLDMLKAGFVTTYLEKAGSMESPFAAACYMAVQNAAIASMPDGERKTVCQMESSKMDEAQKKLRKTVLSGTVRPKVEQIKLALALATPDLEDSAKLIAKAEKGRIARKEKEAKRRAEIKATAVKAAAALAKRAPQTPTAPVVEAKVEAKPAANVPYWVSSRNNVVSVINGLKQKGKGMTAHDKAYAAALKTATDAYDKAIKAAKK